MGYRAKVIDFGYSTRYVNDKQRLDLPISEPWNAPEIDDNSSTWTTSEAEKTDLYSFGMLCLWLLFGPLIPGTKLELQGEVLQEKKNKLPQYAQELLNSDRALGDEKKAALEEFFNSSLSHVPEQRKDSLQKFLDTFDPQR